MRTSAGKHDGHAQLFWHVRQIGYGGTAAVERHASEPYPGAFSGL